MASDMNPFGRRVRMAVRMTGMSDREFCSYSGISYSWLHSIVSRDEEPRWATNLRRFARITGTPVEELMRL